MRQQTMEIIMDTVYETRNAMDNFNVTETELWGGKVPPIDCIVDVLYDDFQRIASECYGNKASNFDSKKAIKQELKKQYLIVVREMEV